MIETHRTTLETDIRASLALSPGTVDIKMPSGFFGHMLNLLAHHAGWTLSLTATGDTHVDAHHLVEDAGIVLGGALQQALAGGEKRERYGWCALPMDGTLMLVAVDLSNRAYCGWEGAFPSPKCGDFDTELVPEFWRAFAREARVTLHFRALAVDNAHHLAEAAFKGAGRALRQALGTSPIDPSTKGVWV